MTFEQRVQSLVDEVMDDLDEKNADVLRVQTEEATSVWLEKEFEYVFKELDKELRTWLEDYFEDFDDEEKSEE